MRSLRLILFFFLATITFAQQSNKVTIVGDSLVGKIVAGEKIRNVIGNVKISAGKSDIFADVATQHLSSGNIDLYGNIVFVQDTIRIETSRAHFLSDSDSLSIDTNFTAIVNHFLIKGGEGSYSKKEDVVRIKRNSSISQKGFNLNADRITFYRFERKIKAVGNVTLLDSSSTLNCDSLIYFTNQKITLAFNNVKVKNLGQNFLLFGDVLRDSSKKNFTEVIGNPLLIKVDSSSQRSPDTLFVISKRMTVKNDSVKILKAFGEVQIKRNNLLLSADFALFKVDSNLFKAIKTNIYGDPVKLWFNNNQASGDSIIVKIKDNRLNETIIKKNALLISIEDSTSSRFNQISGEKIEMNFAMGKLKTINVEGSVLSIYYITDNGVPNGLVKSSSRKTKLVLDSNEVVQVKLYGTPKSEYHPENLVKGKETEFLLPTFRIYSDKPKRIEFAKRIR